MFNFVAMQKIVASKSGV